MTRSQSFNRRHRPSSLKQFVFPDPSSERGIKEWLRAGGRRPLLLYGPSQTGKSVLAELLFGELYPDVYPAGVVFKFFLSSIKRSSTTTKEIESTVSCASFVADVDRYLIFEEVDRANKPVQRFIRTQIDQREELTHFVFTTNYIKEVDVALRAKARKVQIGPPDPDGWVPRINDICAEEGVSAPDYDHAQNMVRLSNGNCSEIVQLVENHVYNMNSVSSIEKEG